MAKHKTVKVQFGKMSGKVDSRLAPLIELMWKCFIHTSKCECDDRMITIHFPSGPDLRLFINVVVAGSDNRVYNSSIQQRVFGYHHQVEPDNEEAEIEIAKKNWWSYGITLDDEFTDPPDIELRFWAKFPQSDMAEIKKHLKGYTEYMGIK